MAFSGFSEDTFHFLQDLSLNNNREWFTREKKRYQQVVKEPSETFLEAMLDEVAAITEVPMDGKIFRINRDVRFSKDKTPYNTHIRMLFHPVMEVKACGDAPAFFLSLEIDHLIIGTGLREFSKDFLVRYRSAVDDADKGTKLEQLLAAQLAVSGTYLEEPELKRVPNGYDADHPRGELLRRKSLSIWQKTPLCHEIYVTGAARFIGDYYRRFQPVYVWLGELSS